MELNDILNLNIENLAQQKYKALKEHALNKLSKVYTLLKEDKLDEVRKLLLFSRAGDDMGDDNYFINFAWNSNDKHGKDLEYVLNMLEDLR